MKNRLTDSIYKAWRTGILPLVTTLLLLTGCEMDSAMDLPLNVDSNKYTLTADAGSTQVRIYSTGEWSARLSEDVDWATIDRLGGEGNGWITFKYAANYGVPRTVDILFNRGGGEQVIRMTQEGKDPILSLKESRIEIFSNPWDLSVGMENNLKEDYRQIKDTIVYSVIPDEDDDETPEPDQEWIENLEIGTDAVTFSTLENTSPRKRQAEITLTYIDAKEKKHAVTLTVTQATEQAFMTFTPDRAKTTRKATTIKAELKHNLGSLLASVVCTPTYNEASTGWIENITLEDKTLSFDVKENDSEAPRSASISFTLPNGTGTLTPVAPFVVEQTYEADYRTLIKGESGQVVINNPEAFFEGIVISDKDNANVESTPNSAPNATDYTVNAKTAYVQMLDGSYGYRLQLNAASDNTLERYSQVKIALNGVTLTKEANPERYTLSGLTAANIVSQTPGTASDLIRKEKSIGQLTDEDIYTYVSLKEVEFALPDGSYTNVNEGYFGTANFVSCVPRTLCDKNGGTISMLVNNKTPWRRDGSGMPKGKGTLSGIIVHDLQPRYGYTNEGYIGRYSVRVLEKEEIELAASESSSNRKTLVEWNWNDAAIKTNTDGTIAPDLGSGSLWCTDPAATNALDNEYNGLTTGAGLNSKNALKFENTYWWNFNENTGYAVALKFSTEGAGENLSLNFTNSQGNAGGTSIYGPVHWQVEYSTDGVNFTVVPESGFCARPFVFWASTMTYCATPGYADRVFILPDALRNQPEVTLLIKARSTQCIASNTATVDQGDTGTITSGMATNKRSPMRFGTIAVKSNK